MKPAEQNQKGVSASLTPFSYYSAYYPIVGRSIRPVGSLHHIRWPHWLQKVASGGFSALHRGHFLASGFGSTGRPHRTQYFALGGQGFPASGAGRSGRELPAAVGTEFRTLPHRLPTGGTGVRFRRRRRGGSAPERLGDHPRHHEPHPHAEARPRLALRLGGGLQGHRGLHLQELVHVVEDAQPALVVDRLLHLGRRRDRIDVEVREAQTELGEVLLEDLFQLSRKFVVFCREIEDGLDPLPHEVVETRDDDPVEILGDLFRRGDPLRPDEAVDEEDRLEDPEVEDAEGPQADEPEFLVPEGDGIAGAPGEVGEDLHVDEVDLGAQGARHPPGDAQDLRQDGDVRRLQGVPSRPEGVEGLPVVKEDGGLALADGHLRAPFDLPRSLLGDPVDEFLPRFIEPLDDFQKYDVVRSHGSPSRIDKKEG